MKRWGFIKGQKNWPTRLLTIRQLDFIDRHIKGDVLDVGCGEGIIGAIYSNVTSCDIKDYNKYGIKVDIAPAEKLPYPDKSFDTVCLMGVIEHTSNPASALSECRRVLRDGGSLVMAYPAGNGWKILKTLIPSHGVKLHADFKMNGYMKDWWLNKKETIFPSFFVGEVYV